MITKAGWVYLLPTENIGFMVKYQPKWLISCILPSKNRKITVKARDYDNDVDYVKEMVINHPSLLLSHSIILPWIKSKNKDYFLVHAVDLDKKDQVYAKPYRLGNVYSSGSICFGDISLDGDPKNLRQANNFFWGTPFNEDNTPFFDLHYASCKNRFHEYYACRAGTSYGCNCECCLGICMCSCSCRSVDLIEGFFTWVKNYNVSESEFVVKTKYFCGEKYFACSSFSPSIFISNNKEFLSNIPEKHWRLDSSQTPVIIGASNQENGRWNIDLGSYTFTLSNNEIEIL